MLHSVGTGQGQRQTPPRTLLRTILGDVLRRTRREQHRTLAEVSQDARVSMQYLSELERGRKEASSEVLAALCEALGVDLAYLLSEIGQLLAEDQAARAPVIRLRNLAEDRATIQQPPARALGPGEILSLLAA
jgi:transcriptional regulator with XRE-family HTH domain